MGLTTSPSPPPVLPGPLGGDFANRRVKTRAASGPTAPAIPARGTAPSLIRKSAALTPLGVAAISEASETPRQPTPDPPTPAGVAAVSDPGTGCERDGVGICLRLSPLGSAASMLLRSLSAVSQSLASKPMVAVDRAAEVVDLRAMS